MKLKLVLASLLAAGVVAVGCAPAPDDSAANARAVSAEMPKSTSSAPDMPEPPGGISRNGGGAKN